MLVKPNDIIGVNASVINYVTYQHISQFFGMLIHMYYNVHVLPLAERSYKA